MLPAEFLPAQANGMVGSLKVHRPYSRIKKEVISGRSRRAEPQLDVDGAGEGKRPMECPSRI